MSAHSNIPEDVAALITAHALGALDADQAELAERHIAASDDCRRAYEDALDTAAMLALAVTDSEPPADLRGRILAAARAEGAEAAPALREVTPRRRSRLAGWLTPSTGFAVLGVAAAIVFALVAVSQHDSANSARDREQALAALIAAPGARVVPMLPSGGGGAGGRGAGAEGRAAPPGGGQTTPGRRPRPARGLPPPGGGPGPPP